MASKNTPNGYWNYERCYEEAKKCSSRSGLQKNNPVVYRKARVNKWLDDYYWFTPKVDKKPDGFWNKENCYKEAQKYNSRASFSAGNQPAYQNARKNGWLDDYSWFIEKTMNNPGYWNYERCYEEAKKCSSRNEFGEKCRSAYTAAWKNGWLNDYSWFKEPFKHGYWNEETCYAAAKECTSRSDFGRKYGRAYELAKKNGWIDSYNWFQRPTVSNERIYVVYCYKDEENNVIYVGLANDIVRRHREHCNGVNKHGKKIYDIVYRYFHAIGKYIPQPVIIKNGLLANEAQEYEEFYIEEYKRQGFNVLNLAKAGSLGSYTKWDREKCYNEAKKYETRTEFMRGSSGAYSVANRNGWVNTYVWFKELRKPNGYWNRETCYEAATHYKTKSEFKKVHNKAYNLARAEGWLKEYTWFDKKKEPNRHWTYEKVTEEAKKYKTSNGFKAACGGAYGAAVKNGWLKDYTWFVNGNIKWTQESCYNEARKYRSRNEFKHGNNGAYQAASKNGWIDDFTWLKRQERESKYNYEICKQMCSECSGRYDLEKKHRGCIQWIRKHHKEWLDEFFPKSK